MGKDIRVHWKVLDALFRYNYENQHAKPFGQFVTVTANRPSGSLGWHTESCIGAYARDLPWNRRKRPTSPNTEGK